MIYRDVLVPEVNNSELPKPAAYYIDLMIHYFKISKKSFQNVWNIT